MYLLRIFILIAISPLTYQAEAPDDDEESPETTECYPKPKPGVNQYIIGYGSLMNEKSKNRTAPNTGPNIPIILTGWSRVWNCKGVTVGSSTTYLGTVKSRLKNFPAIFFKLPNQGAGMDAYDAREKFYCRVLMRNQNIKIQPKNISPPNGQYWLYVTRKEFSDKPSKKYPMIQSYVDTFLSGCLAIEKKHKIPSFAKQCVTSTEGWMDGPWVNDRIYPRRAFLYEPMALAIDKLLHENVPDAYKNIQIE